MVDSTLSHEALLRFEEIERRLDELEGKGDMSQQQEQPQQPQPEQPQPEQPQPQPESNPFEEEEEEKEQ